jgi:hypothetical protein
MSQFSSDVTRLRMGLRECVPGRKRLPSEPRCLYPSIGEGGVQSVGSGRMVVDIRPVSLAPIAVKAVVDNEPSLHLRYAVVLVGAPDETSEYVWCSVAVSFLLLVSSRNFDGVQHAAVTEKCLAVDIFRVEGCWPRRHPCDVPQSCGWLCNRCSIGRSSSVYHWEYGAVFVPD